MTGYELSRNWFDWAFENPDLNTPTHTALYMWFIEKWNRCGQKDKISITTSESMEVLGISSRNTFGKVFKELCEWNFVTVVVDSKNQYSCKVITLAQNLCKQDETTNKALDKALIKHTIKQDESTDASIDTINKQSNNVTIEQSNNVIEEISKEIFEARILELERENQELKAKKEKEKSSAKKEKEEPPSQAEFMDYAKSIVENELKKPFDIYEFVIFSKYETWLADGWKDGNKKSILNWKSKFKNTLPYLKPVFNGSSNNNNATGQTAVGTPQRSNLFGKDGKSANRLVEIGKRPSISLVRQQGSLEVCE